MQKAKCFCTSYILMFYSSTVTPLEGARGSLFLRASVAAHELIDATSGVDQLALTSVEGVRGVTDFKLEQGISLAFELDGFACLSG